MPQPIESSSLPTPVIVKINVRAPGSFVYISGISQKATIEWIKVERGLQIYYQLSYWLDAEQKFTMVHENEITDLP